MSVIFSTLEFVFFMSSVLLWLSIISFNAISCKAAVFQKIAMTLAVISFLALIIVRANFDCAGEEFTMMSLVCAIIALVDIPMILMLPNTFNISKKDNFKPSEFDSKSNVIQNSNNFSVFDSDGNEYMLIKKS